MKQNKDIKKGDKIWTYCACLGEKEYSTVLKVKKVKTLVEVVIIEKFFNKEFEVTMYGHSSSSLLSGYHRSIGNVDMVYTCDYDLIQKKTKKYNSDERYIEAGRALLNVAKYFK